MTGHPERDPLPLASVALVSAVGLAYEIVLIRLFAVIQWHHFAYMVISLALLGFGLSGTLLSLYRSALLARFRAVYIALLVCVGPLCVAAAALAGRVIPTPERILWDPWLLGWSVLAYACLALPFACVGGALGLVLSRHSSRAGRIYGADLGGAGVGAMLGLIMLYVVSAGAALRWIGLAGLLAAVLAALELRVRSRGAVVAVAVLAAGLAAAPAAWFEPAVSPYKSLSQYLLIPGSQKIGEYSSPLGLITVVANERVPLREAPGLALNASAGPPEQLAVFVDADGPMALDAAAPGVAGDPYLLEGIQALPFAMRPPGDRVLVLGAGTGQDVRTALLAGARHVDAVELDPQLVRLVTETEREFAGGLYQRDDVGLHIAEARGFVGAHAGPWGVIQLPVPGAFGAAGAGLYALGEDYLTTVEAFGDYLGRLSPGGYLVAQRWLRLPPRDALKLVLTAMVALGQTGVRRPGDHLLVARGWQSSVMIVKREPLTLQEISAAREFCERFRFDLAWYPGIAPGEVNRYNRLDSPYLYYGIVAALADLEAFIADYKFDLRPATDDRPFFGEFFRWSVLPELWGLRLTGGAALLESSYLVLVATLCQALILSVVFILLPLWLGKAGRGQAQVERWRVLGYFVALGLGFMFVEMVFVHRLSLFLHHPVVAAATVLAGFLVFAGLGSLCSRAWLARAKGPMLVLPLLGIVLLGGVQLVALPQLLALCADFALLPRIAVALAVVAPLAFLMGMPFPTGLSLAGARSPDLVPWAWATNGCASVVAAVLATLLAVELGFRLVLVAALGCYLLAAVLLAGRSWRSDVIN